MSTHAQIVNLGPIKITGQHDYRQFLKVVALTMAVGLALYWVHDQKFLLHIYSKIGIYFTAGFAVLLLAGLWAGLVESWEVSQGLNGLKRAQLNADELKKLFGIEDFVAVDVSLLKDEIENSLWLRMDKVHYIAKLAALLGYFGTAFGIAMALEPFGSIKNAEQALAKLPEFAGNLAIAFYTTLVGIVIAAILTQMYRFVRSAATELQSRIFRALHENLQAGS